MLFGQLSNLATNIGQTFHSMFELCAKYCAHSFLSPLASNQNLELIENHWIKHFGTNRTAVCNEKVWLVVSMKKFEGNYFLFMFSKVIIFLLSPRHSILDLRFVLNINRFRYIFFFDLIISYYYLYYSLLSLFFFC